MRGYDEADDTVEHSVQSGLARPASPSRFWLVKAMTRNADPQTVAEPASGRPNPFAAP